MTYDTKVEDLSEERQKDFYDTLARLGRSEEWGKIALTINPISAWEQWGFGAFTLDWLQAKVNRIRLDRELTIADLHDEMEKLRDRVEVLEDMVKKP